MKKILLIDDRRDEQAVLLRQHEIDLSKYKDYIDNLSGEESLSFFTKFNINDESLLQYKVWIIHQTLFNKMKGIQRKVERFCKQNNIQLVLFSGSISIVMIKQKTGLLKMSRDGLYKNLKIFLEHSKRNEPQLGILGFGNNWKAVLLSNVEDSIEEFLDNVGETISIELFKCAINNFDTAVKILDNVKFMKSTGSINRDEVESLLHDIKGEIKEQMEM